MKIFVALISTLLLLLAFHEASSAAQRAPSELTTCKVKIDGRTVFGKGANIHEARSQASERCFDSRLDQYQSQRGGVPEGEQADLILDSCVNIKCS